MKTKKIISVVVLFVLFFSFKHIALAQVAASNAPVFVLQGAVKQKGRAIQGVELSLTKDGKQVAKIITPKNGLYYFQLNKSSTDTQSEYILKINKQGVVSGVLRVNTYVPKEQFTSIPYLFNLDITFNPESTVKKDFGKINWFVEKNAFDFDRNYIPIPEKDSVAIDSALASKKQVTQDSSTNQASMVQNNSNLKDSSVSFSTNTNTQPQTTSAVVSKQTSLDATNKTFADVVNASSADKKNTTNNNEETLDKLKKDATTTTVANNNSTTTVTKLKNEDVLNSSLVKNPLLKSPSTSNSKVSAKTDEKVVNTNSLANSKPSVKTDDKAENTLAKNNTSLAVSKNQSLVEQQRVKANENNNVDVAKANNNASVSAANTTEAVTISRRDSLAANSTIQKDLFFLTGVPMGQFKTNLPSPNPEIKNSETYDVDKVYSTNSERSRLLSEKQRFERKKAENFAKKLETNNTLTSLMNEVDEFDKKNK